MKLMRNLKLNAKLNMYIISVFLLIFGFTIGVIVYNTMSKAKRDAVVFSKNVGAKEVAHIETYLEQVLSTSQTLAEVLLSLKQEDHADRDLALSMLKQCMIGNDEYLAVWTMWEPNAFDGKDAYYAEKFNQELGLFSGSCYRSKEEILFQNYGSEGLVNY